MRKWFSVPLVLLCFACPPSSELPAPPPIGPRATPVGVQLSGYRGMTRITEALDRVREAHSSMFGVRATWAEIEPVPGSVSFTTSEFEQLDVVAEVYPELLQMFVVSIKVINVSVRAMPPDLMGLPFNHPVVLLRMEAVIDALAAHDLAGSIDCILLGQESDSYLTAHPNEVAAFVQLLQFTAERARQRLPGVSVSTTVTFNGVRDHPEITTPLIDSSDWAVYTYYPLNLGTRALTMRPVANVAADLDFLISQAGSKPVAFWEVGYSSHPINLGSQQNMDAFVRELYTALEPYHQAQRLRFVQYFMLHDYPVALARQFAEEQGSLGPGTVEYLSSLGLREYENGGRPKLAWSTYVALAEGWAGR